MAEQHVIPKVVHQTWKTHTVPDHWKESEQSWRALEKHGWTYILWDDTEIDAFISDNYPWFLEQFRGYKRGISRADAVRPFLLHKYGGLYVDLDIVAKETEFMRFYELVKGQQVVLPQTKVGNGVDGQNLSNCFMMSQPGAEFWPHVWHRLQHPYKDRPFKAVISAITPYFRTLFSTGPGVISDSYNTYKNRSQIYIAPAALVQPGSDNRPKPHQAPNSVVKVIEGSSWHPKDAKFWRGFGWFLRYQREVMGALIGVLVAIVIGLSVWVSVLRRGPAN